MAETCIGRCELCGRTGRVVLRHNPDPTRTDDWWTECVDETDCRPEGER